MAATPTQPLKTPFTEPVPDSTAHFWLAVVVLFAYVGLLVWFGYRPSALPPEQVARGIQSFGDLAKMAIIWFFLRQKA